MGVVGAVPPCNKGLACLPLQAGGDAGSGYGYCTVLGRPDSNLVGAAAVHVSVRRDDSGKSCRLPVVYKCAPAASTAAAASTADSCTPPLLVPVIAFSPFLRPSRA